ncbi:MAG: DNA mismatch repair endonuclease MutL [Deltaproteobacteria bacterium]|nr:DNA mismatch repair endonuclease MutL [Deltaproteobacteria bacterium]
MARIQILPDNLTNQIAAGEVVERPAAVVKELVENSIDARSLKIHVALSQGGRKEIRVVDNGIGMAHDDALLAIERHATSKIKNLQDLEAVASLGFRGEALPSIASVSRFELVTREDDSLAGTLIRVEGGVLREARETGCPRGTMVTVRDLFYNVPARRKFLRTVDTEMAHIGDRFVRLAMAHPAIHFQLVHQERTLYDFQRTGNHAGRVAQVLGPALSGRLMPFRTERRHLTVHGFLAPPELQRPNAQYLFQYVNGRPVWERMLNRAVLSAYEALIPKGKYPVVVLFIDIAHGLVDINVHPTKREVRFREPSEVMEAVREAVFRGLESHRPNNTDASRRLRGTLLAREDQAVTAGPPSTHPAHRGEPVPIKAALGASPPSGIDSPVETDPPPHAASAEASFPDGRPFHRTTSPEALSPVSPGFSRLPFIGQVGNVYLLLEAPDGLLLIDQHAAHERILYDRLSQSTRAGARQRLLHSVVIHLLPKESAKLTRWLDQLNRIGFEIEPFGRDSFVIAAVPAVLSDVPPDTLLREVLGAAHEDEKNPSWNLTTSLASTAACHSAVRAGQKLKPDEVRALLHDLDATAMPFTCPHGRPLWVKLTHSELARLFHRT